MEVSVLHSKTYDNWLLYRVQAVTCQLDVYRGVYDL